MDNTRTFALTLLILGSILLSTSRISYTHGDFSAGPPDDAQMASLMNEGKKAALLICEDGRGCDYIRQPLEELSDEFAGDLVVYKVNAGKYCAAYPSRCPKQMPALILYKDGGGRAFYGDVPKAWLKEYLLGFRDAR